MHVLCYKKLGSHVHKKERGKNIKSLLYLFYGVHGVTDHMY